MVSGLWTALKNDLKFLSNCERSKSVIEKFLEIERGGGGVSACGKQNIP